VSVGVNADVGGGGGGGGGGGVYVHICLCVGVSGLVHRIINKTTKKHQPLSEFISEN